MEFWDVSEDQRFYNLKELHSYLKQVADSSYTEKVIRWAFEAEFFHGPLELQLSVHKDDHVDSPDDIDIWRASKI